MTPHQSALKSLQEGSVPDWGDCLKMIAAHLDNMNKTYVEIALDPKTKEVAWSFEPTPLFEKGESSEN